MNRCHRIPSSVYTVSYSTSCLYPRDMSEDVGSLGGSVLVYFQIDKPFKPSPVFKKLIVPVFLDEYFFGDVSMPVTEFADNMEFCVECLTPVVELVVKFFI